MGNSLFGTGFLKLEAAASARERMQTVHAGNIANADTPNYKADRRTFADFLAARQTEGGLTTTNSSHMDSVAGSSLKKSMSTVQRMDGNSVDIQQEMANLAENQMMHELSLRLLKGRISGLSNVIKEGGR
ncbi:MAG: flagellar basal body rod protein FlgB [Mariprofundaceae bacterium]